MKKIILLLLYVIISPLCIGNQYEIGLLTCSPGEELYSIFGHSAIAVLDKESGETTVYNYGCFNFGTENFYFKFASGNLEYYLGHESLQSFSYTYMYEQRGVLYNRLYLSDIQTEALTKTLADASLPENRYYKYRFITRNCATEILNILIPFIDNPLNREFLDTPSSFTARELINENLNNHYLTRLGLALILGSKVDKTLTLEETCFIPSHLKQILSTVEVDGRSFLDEDVALITQPNTDRQKNSFLSHYVIAITLILIGIMTIINKNAATDYFYTSFLALVGFVIMSLMFFSEHPEVQANYNILWCNPLLPLMIPLLKRSEGLWRHLVIVVYSACFFTIALLWCCGIQHYETEFILCLMINIWLMIKHSTRKKTKSDITKS